MNEEYLIGRMQASLEMARNAVGSVARLIHFELAGRYSLAAAHRRSDPLTYGPQGQTSFFRGSSEP